MINIEDTLSKHRKLHIAGTYWDDPDRRFACFTYKESEDGFIELGEWEYVTYGRTINEAVMKFEKEYLNTKFD